MQTISYIKTSLGINMVNGMSFESSNTPPSVNQPTQVINIIPIFYINKL